MSAPPSSSRPTVEPERRSYIRRVAVPPVSEVDLASASSSSSPSHPSRARRAAPPPSLQLPAASSSSPAPKVAHYRTNSMSSAHSPIAGPSVPTKPSHQVLPDPPLSADSMPSYPPPPPPKTRPTPPTQSSLMARNPERKRMTKKEAYLAQKSRLNGAKADKLNEDEKAGLINQDDSPSPNPSDLTTTWSIQDETAFLDLPKSIIHPPRLDPKVVEPFTVHGIPSPKLIWQAGMCEVKDEMGISVKFRDLISRDPKRRTLVFFIRHTFCGQCQNFVDASIRELDPVALSEANVDVILISNGHWAVSKKYRELFDCPFPLFQDSSRKLYNYLGMTLLNNDFGSLKQADRARYNTQSVPSQLVHGIGNGLFKMPLRDPGKLTQLGGEFVFGPASTCHFAHRMKHTSDHWEAIDVAAKAGVDPDAHFRDRPMGYGLGGATGVVEVSQQVKRTREAAARLRQEAADRLAEAEERAEQVDWELQRETELDRIRRKKLQRRAGHLRAASMGGAALPPMSPSPPVSPMGSGMESTDDVRMTRAEFEAELRQKELEKRWEEEEREAELRRRVEEEVEKRMRAMMLGSAVPPPSPPNREYGDDETFEDEGEEGEEWDGEEEGGEETDQDRSPQSAHAPLRREGDQWKGEERMREVQGEVRHVDRGA